jgi:hypothetical protein
MQTGLTEKANDWLLDPFTIQPTSLAAGSNLYIKSVAIRFYQLDFLGE